MLILTPVFAVYIGASAFSPVSSTPCTAAMVRVTFDPPLPDELAPPQAESTTAIVARIAIGFVRWINGNLLLLCQVRWGEISAFRFPSTRNQVAPPSPCLTRSPPTGRAAARQAIGWPPPRSASPRGRHALCRHSARLQWRHPRTRSARRDRRRRTDRGSSPTLR